MTAAREKAIERLAAILAGRMENTSTVTGAEEDGVLMLAALATHRPHIAEKIRNHAAVIFDVLSLAAIDPAHVEQVESIERTVEAQGGWRGRDQAALVDAKIAIADAVLAQLRGGR